MSNYKILNEQWINGLASLVKHSPECADETLDCLFQHEEFKLALQRRAGGAVGTMAPPPLTSGKKTATSGKSSASKGNSSNKGATFTPRRGNGTYVTFRDGKGNEISLNAGRKMRDMLKSGENFSDEGGSTKWSRKGNTITAVHIQHGKLVGQANGSFAK